MFWVFMQRELRCFTIIGCEFLWMLLSSWIVKSTSIHTGTFSCWVRMLLDSAMI